MRYPLTLDHWGAAEEAALRRVVDSGRLTMGPEVARYERAFADRFGALHAIAVNSGSSANLIALAALRYSGRLAPGDEVIVPAVSWATTYYPVTQQGLGLVFVDVDAATFNLDPAQVEAAIGPRTRAVLAVNVLGAPCDFDALEELCTRHDLLLIEDNCESMGALYRGRHTGTIGVLGTFSTYFSHHLNTIEGGVVLTNDPELDAYCRSLRSHGWIRGLPEDNPVYPPSGDPLRDAFLFALPGYNLRTTEINAALGLVQLDQLDDRLELRAKNAARYIELFGDCEFVDIQRPTGESSWFGFSFALKGPLQGRRSAVGSALTAAGIESRPVIAGNFVRQPVMRHLPHRVAGPLPNADRIHDQGFYTGNAGIDLSDNLEHLHEVLQTLVRRGT